MSEFIQGVEKENDGKLVVPSWGKKGKWYKVTLEKEDGKYSVKDYDSELPTVTATDYGVDIATSKDGKDFHLISIASDPEGIEPFMYPVVGKNITSDDVYAVDFNKPNTNVSLKINDTAATVSQTVNGLVQKNINLSASVEGGSSYITVDSTETISEIYSKLITLNNECSIGTLLLSDLGSSSTEMIISSSFLVPCVVTAIGDSFSIVAHFNWLSSQNKFMSGIITMDISNTKITISCLYNTTDGFKLLNNAYVKVWSISIVN